jgi:hypothetical protein
VCAWCNCFFSSSSLYLSVLQGRHLSSRTTLSKLRRHLQADQFKWQLQVNTQAFGRLTSDGDGAVASLLPSLSCCNSRMQHHTKPQHNSNHPPPFHTWLHGPQLCSRVADPTTVTHTHNRTQSLYRARPRHMHSSSSSSSSSSSTRNARVAA